MSRFFATCDFAMLSRFPCLGIEMLLVCRFDFCFKFFARSHMRCDHGTESD
ncbi:hypothetical protein TELCIR_03696 [Teladorsagia circumcincta]|uniref:C2H2-type domain-containing protein n=1 Tax=Teladorsagia circumcincta TaxID=45464 RepID=A0A2G9UXR2_TELCI|nr:hypothetical protein TELCIR_03696 [Teladorsagia circumcincta]